MSGVKDGKPTRSPEGIRVRHSRGCRSRDGARCDCRPSYEAWVYLRREDRKLRKTHPTLAAAKAWRADARSAADRGKLRGRVGPQPRRPPVQARHGPRL
jgi:hypothetical protein